MTRAEIERDQVGYIQHIDVVVGHISDVQAGHSQRLDRIERVLTQHTDQLKAIKTTQDAMQIQLSEILTILRNGKTDG
ncbi:hypothetical protein [Amycolatopsis panacis]|uniref:Uncharacterized protein n=1 Tax=Amycolatopsis panacis TaxID=2340917 RepID=A0A419I9K1_9PSEU|nr:hypothetical protein [Amycolatopsis panacis]RJQ89095.1 hypothetical protein D5S19_05350 [Amycolatopsis panacis]